MAAARGAVGVTTNVGAAFAQCSSKCKCTSVAQSTKTSKALPVFGMPSPTEHNNSSSKGNNKRSRKQLSSPKLTAVFEYACGANSMFGRVHAELKVPHVRLSKDAFNVQDPRIAEQLHSQLRDPARKQLWVSLPCTSGCPWHRVGLAAEYRKRHAKEGAAAKALFKQFKEHAETALSHGHDVTLEWPRYSDSWKRKDVMDFFRDSRFMSVDFDGCRFGVRDEKGRPLKKPWRLMTTSNDIVEAFKGMHCQHKPEEHGEGRGKALERTGFYTQPLCELVAKTINPTVWQVLVPALPTAPVQRDSNHREKEQETSHVSALSGLVDLATVVEADEEARQLIENVVDRNAIISEISDLPEDPASPDVTAMVTKLLSRAEMLSSPRRSLSSRGSRRTEIRSHLG